MKYLVKPGIVVPKSILYRDLQPPTKQKENGPMYNRHHSPFSQGCPTFGHLWATLEEELSWVTHEIHKH